MLSQNKLFVKCWYGKLIVCQVSIVFIVCQKGLFWIIIIIIQYIFSNMFFYVKRLFDTVFSFIQLYISD